MYSAKKICMFQLSSHSYSMFKGWRVFECYIVIILPAKIFCMADYVGFSAIVVPMGRDPQSDSELWEYWVAKIKDIRAVVYDENSNAVRVFPQVKHFTLNSASPLIRRFGHACNGSTQAKTSRTS